MENLQSLNVRNLKDHHWKLHPHVMYLEEDEIGQQLLTIAPICSFRGLRWMGGVLTTHRLFIKLSGLNLYILSFSSLPIPFKRLIP